jgi:general secretion pathway protein K
MKSSGESGVALLTVLLIVLALSGISVTVLEDMRRSQRLEANATSTTQAQWYAIGADAYVRDLAERLRTSGRQEMAGGEYATVLPLDDGAMEIHITDASTCINLNGVVAGAGDIFQRHETGAGDMEYLMRALGLQPGQSADLTNALIDWIDTDDGSRGAGRDDFPYMGQSPAYMTGREPLAEVSELRAIEGYTDRVYETLRPHVCAHPSVGPSSLNINALTPDDAPVLVALLRGAMPEATARRLIASRPEQGWTSVDDFWTSPLVAEAATTADAARSRLSLEPDYLNLTVRIRRLDAEVVMTELLAWRSGRFVTASRRWSEDS